MKITYSFLIIIVLSLTTCKKDNTVSSDLDQELTIFFMNDLHGQIDNFSKVKYIIDEEKENTDVLVVCAGDIFSGNPVVDIYEPQGYPMIDLLNEIGTDVMAIGNHEFDYGEETFRDRVEQSDFPWICANIDPGTSVISDPPEYVTLNIGELKVTVIGFIETVIGNPIYTKIGK
jgi:5'-nucleotidase/UDP-sugar diphosphatase